MSEKKNYIAVDLGAESGRLMLGTLDGNTLELREAHRFSNGPLEQGGSLRWDFPRLIMEIRRGLRECARMAEGEIAGIGVDSWGVDFGLLDADGKLIENPYHYRDARTEGMFEEAFKRVPKREVYEATGLQFMRLNTLYQVLAMHLAGDPALEKADKLMFMADLVSHELCGEVFAEYSLASTSQMMNMRTGEWSRELLERLDLPAGILPKVVPSGTVLAPLAEEIAADAGMNRASVIAVASHDTGCAVAAVPAAGTDWAYISSGTWSLIGVELKTAAINDAAFENSFTNEGGVEGTIRFLKNVGGLWLVQECRREWQGEGDDYSYAELQQMAERGRPFAARIDPDQEPFLAPGDMPEKINQYLASTGQERVEDRGTMVRAILESLAFTYRSVIENMEAACGRGVKVVHIVGGGSQNELLNQFTANATRRPAVTGPIEATAIGNILIQAKATEQVTSLDEIREIVGASFPTQRCNPTERDLWSEEYRNWCKVVRG